MLPSMCLFVFCPHLELSNQVQHYSFANCNQHHSLQYMCCPYFCALVVLITSYHKCCTQLLYLCYAARPMKQQNTNQERSGGHGISRFLKHGGHNTVRIWAALKARLLQCQMSREQHCSRLV